MTSQREDRSYYRTRRLVVAGFAFVILGVGLLAYSTRANADSTIICEPCSFPYQQWVYESQVPTPNITIEVEENSIPCQEIYPNSPACTDSEIMNIACDCRFIFYHEMGHIFEIEWIENSPSLQDKIAKIINHPKLGWEVIGAGENSLNEVFAEAYSLCAGLPKIKLKKWFQLYSVFINGAHLRHLCKVIKQIGYYSPPE